MIGLSSITFAFPMAASIDGRIRAVSAGSFHVTGVNLRISTSAFARNVAAVPSAISRIRWWIRWTTAIRRAWLGIEAIVPTDIAEYRIEANDIYLLCSDGLTDMVDPEVIHSIIDEKRSDLAVAAGDLIDLANQNGGRDNISVVLIRIPPEFLPTSGWAQRWLAKKKG